MEDLPPIYGIIDILYLSTTLGIPIFLFIKLPGCTFSCQEASAAISGVGVYGKLKFESGIHRVQVALPTIPITNDL